MVFTASCHAASCWFLPSLGGSHLVAAAQYAPATRLAFLVVGVALLATAVVDLLWTTLWVDGGAGPLSSRLANRAWRVFRRAGDDHPRLKSLTGPVVLVATLGVWFGLFWVGWTLLFAGGERTLVDARNVDPVGWIERSYFVGYTLFTLGNGDFSPDGHVWQLATALTSASGMLFVTLSVTYVLSVIGAVVDKRSFASGVTGLGGYGEALALAGWDGEDFRDLDQSLETIAGELDQLAEQHKAYPILHYYHSEHGEDAAPVAVAALDEALTLLRCGVDGAEPYNAAVVKSARGSARSYLQTLGEAFIQPADEPPPAPDLDRLREAGVPTVSDERFAADMAEMADRRRNLRGVVEADTWDWRELEPE